MLPEPLQEMSIFNFGEKKKAGARFAPGPYMVKPVDSFDRHNVVQKNSFLPKQRLPIGLSCDASIMCLLTANTIYEICC